MSQNPPTTAPQPGAAARGTPLAGARYAVDHETRYDYAAPVTHSWQIARLTPRALPWQRVEAHSLRIDPAPDERRDFADGCGNTVTQFALHRPHRMLSVRLRCSVAVGARPAVPADAASRAWGAVAEAAMNERSAEGLLAARMSEPSARVPLSAAARRYAEPTLRPGRPWLEALDELTQRIHDEFEFDAEATTVATTVDELLHQRRGVCQDFSQLMIAALRAHGLPARYVSGYLLTDPPEGQPRLLGVDASHAWVAAWAPGCGWVEFDPTNRQRADARYITLGWGADFADVAPLRGVILGGGAQEMSVAVSVLPLDAD